MKIRQTIQPEPVSKVETDRREEVKKIKPIGADQIPDSFETPGSKSASAESTSSASDQTEKKAGQITGGILIKQLTQARLADAGIKIANSGEENSGTRDLNNTQQKQAENTSPAVNTKGNPRTPGSMTPEEGGRVPEGAYTGDARSNMEKHKQALQDFMNQSNIDVPSSGIDASDFGVGEGVDLGNGFNGGQTGPGDPMKGINDKFARMDYAKSLGNAGNRLSSQMQDAAQGMDGGNMGHGKGMVAETIAGEIRDLGKLAGEIGDEFVKSDRLEKELEQQEKYAKEMETKAEKVHARSERIKTLEGQIDNAKKQGMSPIGYAGQQKELEQLKKEQAAEVKRPDSSGTSGTAGSSDTSGSSGTKTAGGGSTDTTDENYVDPLAEKKRKGMDEMLKNLGLDGLWNLQRGPKNQGKGPDYGPEGPGPVGVSAEDAGGSLLSQFGKDGLVGNPNQQNHDGSGPSNFGGLPGETVTDPQEGDPYHGSPRDEEVDVSVQTGMEQNVDDEDNNRTIPANDITKQQSKINPDLKPKLHN